MKLLQELGQLNASRQILNQLSVDCSMFLQNPVAMYRGVKKYSNEIRKMNIRTDRQPLDSTALPVGLFNYLFMKQHGVADIRQKVAFATQDYSQARRYGAVSWVFPTNRCTIWVLSGVKDTLKVMDSLESNIQELIHVVDWDEAIRYANDISYSGKVFEYIAEHGNREAQSILEQAERSHRTTFATYKKYNPGDLTGIPAGEIMISGPAYYAVAIDWAILAFANPHQEEAFAAVVNAAKSATDNQ